MGGGGDYHNTAANEGGLALALAGVDDYQYTAKSDKEQLI